MQSRISSCNSVSRSRTRFKLTLSLGPLFLGGLLALPFGMAQAQTADDELNALIGQDAVGDPEAWASATNPTGNTVPEVSGEPDAAQASQADAQQEMERASQSGAETSSLAEGPTDGAAQDAPALVQDIASAQDAEGEGQLTQAIAESEVIDRADGAQFAGESYVVSDHLRLVFEGTTVQATANGDADINTFSVQDFVGEFAKLSLVANADQTPSQNTRDARGLIALAREDGETLNDLLRSYGFYGAQVNRTLIQGDGAQKDTNAGTDIVVFQISAGPQYRYRNVNLSLPSSLADARTLNNAFAIKAGDAVLSERLTRAEADLAKSLGENGYVFAQPGTPDLAIDHATAAADLNIPVARLGKYRVTGVESNLPKFLSGKHLEDIARFEMGTVYRASMVEDLRRAIIATGLVSSVNLTARELVPAEQGHSGRDALGDVVLDAALTAAPLRTFAGAIGYGSGEGIRSQISWEHRNLFPPEGKFKLRGVLGTREQLVGANFTRNNLGGRDKALVVDAYATSLDTLSYEARSLALSSTFEKRSNYLFQWPFSWSFGGEILATDERSRGESAVQLPRKTYLIASAFGGATIDTSDDLLDPHNGYRLSVRLTPTFSRQGGAGDVYTKLQGDFSAYAQPSAHVVTAMRLRAASIVGAELETIAPSRRLYAGGGASIRGYGYQAISPRDGTSSVSGGRALWEGALEARIQTRLLDGLLSFVPFFDLGAVSAASTPGKGAIKAGAGIGMRYATDFGPIRLDFGIPLNRKTSDAAFGVYISIGQAF